MLSEQNQKDLIHMSSNKQLIQEAFGRCLNERSHVYKLDDDKIFTDAKIREEFKTIIKRQDSYDDKHSDKIMQLVDSNFIIPCYIDSSYLEKIEAYFFREKEKYTRYDNVMGFWDTSLKRIFMLVRHIHNIDYWGKNSAVSSTLTHEFQHCFLNLFPNSFLNLHKFALDSYYSAFLKSFFGIKVSTINARKVYHYLIKTFDSPQDENYNNIGLYFKLLRNLGASKKSIEQFRSALMLYINDSYSFSKSINDKSTDAYRLYSVLRQSYSKIGIVPNMIKSLCVQECIFSGEVICIESEYNRKTRHLSLLDKLHIKGK